MAASASRSAPAGARRLFRSPVASGSRGVLHGDHGLLPRFPASAESGGPWKLRAARRPPAMTARSARSRERCARRAPRVTLAWRRSPRGAGKADLRSVGPCGLSTPQRRRYSFSASERRHPPRHPISNLDRAHASSPLAGWRRVTRLMKSRMLVPPVAADQRSIRGRTLPPKGPAPRPGVGSRPRQRAERVAAAARSILIATSTPEPRPRDVHGAASDRFLAVVSHRQHLWAPLFVAHTASAGASASVSPLSAKGPRRAPAPLWCDRSRRLQCGAITTRDGAAVVKKSARSNSEYASRTAPCRSLTRCGRRTPADEREQRPHRPAPWALRGIRGSPAWSDVGETVSPSMPCRGRYGESQTAGPAARRLSRASSAGTVQLHASGRPLSVDPSNGISDAARVSALICPAASR